MNQLAMNLLRTTAWAGFMLAAVGAAFAQDPSGPEGAAAEQKALQQRIQQFTQPGERHKILLLFIGEWETLTYLRGDESAIGPPEEGSARIGWLMEDRWLRFETQGVMAGQDYSSLSLLGYDNFKRSYVSTTVSSLDTSMNRSEGDLDGDSKSMVLYGAVNDFLTGDIDKMMKTVWRFESRDKIVMEMHDVKLGERRAKVMEVVFTRKPER